MRENLEKKEWEVRMREEGFKNKEIELQQRLAVGEEIRRDLEKQQRNDAVRILENMDDNLIADILIKMDQIAERRGQQSLSSYLLSRLPPDRAVGISERILQK